MRCCCVAISLFSGTILARFLHGLAGTDFFDLALEPSLSAVLIGADQWLTHQISDQAKHNARDKTPYHIGIEKLGIEIMQPPPMRNIGVEYGDEIVAQIMPRTLKPAPQIHLTLKPGAEQEMTGLQRDQTNWDIGQRIAKKRRHECGQNIAVDDARKQRRYDEMKPVEGCKAGEYSDEDPTRDPVGVVGQTIDAMPDIIKRTRPSALRPDEMPKPQSPAFWCAPFKQVSPYSRLSTPPWSIVLLTSTYGPRLRSVWRSRPATSLSASIAVLTA